MKILDEKSIKNKIQRIAYQIAEHNYQSEEIILAGINNNGHAFAKLIEKSLKKIIEVKISVARIKLSPANPLSTPIEMTPKIEGLEKKAVIIVDDVANTGRTIFYAFKPFMDHMPAKIEVAVLVDRKHKYYPVQVDYVGLSIATTLRQNINVKFTSTDEMEVYLD
jgi:pyrimidine operon attenuation protein / uracil phosphoribosyltransferase